MARIQTSCIVPGSIEKVFEYVSDLTHLPDMLEGHFDIEFTNDVQGMKDGEVYELVLSRFGIDRNVRLVIEDYIPNQSFADRQLFGFFKNWYHLQKFEKHDEKQTRLIDIVEYDMPYGLVGVLADDLFFSRDLTQILQSRYHRIIQRMEIASL